MTGRTLLGLYLGSFALFTVVGWGLRREIRQLVEIRASFNGQQQRLADAVVGLNEKLGRAEQEYERRALKMSDGCEAIRRQLEESMMTPTEQFQMDIVQRLQALESSASPRGGGGDDE